MRSFIISLTILAVLIVLVIWNSLWTTNRLDKLCGICDEIENGSPILEELTTSWQDCRKIISLSVNQNEIERVEAAICDLESFPVGSDEFMSGLKELKIALTRISDAQKPTFENIF